MSLTKIKITSLKTTNTHWTLGYFGFLDINNNHINPTDYTNATFSIVNDVFECIFPNGFIIKTDYYNGGIGGERPAVSNLLINDYIDSKKYDFTDYSGDSHEVFLESYKYIEIYLPNNSQIKEMYLTPWNRFGAFHNRLRDIKIELFYNNSEVRLVEYLLLTNDGTTNDDSTINDDTNLIYTKYVADDIYRPIFISTNTSSTTLIDLVEPFLYNSTFSETVDYLLILPPPPLEIINCTLSPPNLIGIDVSSILQLEFNTSITDSPPNFNFTLDPSYIVTLGQMSDVSSGFIWEGTLTRTPNMNKLDNKLDFDFSYNGVEVSANLVFDVIENSDIIGKKWSLSNSDIVNKGFTNILQMSPNGLLMGFIDGSNVEIYRKSDTSYTWNHDASYNGHSFALTNNHIVLANNEYLQIYDYSGISWSIMNGGNITYSNIVALSINLDGTYVAVSDNSIVKLFKNISDNWTHINSYNNGTVIGLSLSPNGLKLGMGIGNTGEDFSSIVVEDVVVVVDTTPPVITLDGSATMTIEVGTTWIEPGYTATDNFDGDITNKVLITGIVDVNNFGVYTLQYDVSDNAYNEAETVTRTVVVSNRVYYNEEEDVLEGIVNLYNYATDYKQIDITVSGKANWWENGLYKVQSSTFVDNNVHTSLQTMVSSNNYFWYGMRINAAMWSSVYNMRLTNINYACYDNTTGYYRSVDAAELNDVYFSHTINGTEYAGEWISYEFPFYVDLKSILISATDTLRMPRTMYVFATNDDTNLDNYVLQGIFNGGENLSFTQNMTSNGISYKKFLLIINQLGLTTSLKIKNIKLFSNGIYV